MNKLNAQTQYKNNNKHRTRTEAPYNTRTMNKHQNHEIQYPKEIRYPMWGSAPRLLLGEMRGAGTKISPRDRQKKKRNCHPNDREICRLIYERRTSKFVYFYQSLWGWLCMKKYMILTLARDAGWQNILFLKPINKWNSKPEADVGN